MTTTERLFYLCELMSVRRLILALYLGVAALLAATTPARAAEEKIWHVKAIHPEGRLLDVKAIDKQGKIHSVKAIQTEGNLHLLDIKALVDDKRLPVKVLVSNDKYAPVKAIGEDGTIFDIKAITPDGASAYVASDLKADFRDQRAGRAVRDPRHRG